MIPEGSLPEDFLKPSPGNLHNSGWLSPEAVMYYCLPFNHDALARVLAKPLGWVSRYEACLMDDVESSPFDGDEYLIRAGWIRCYGNEDAYLCWASHQMKFPNPAQYNVMLDLGYNPHSPKKVKP